MRVRLVIDVLEGRVVRGVAGERDSYQPIESVLTTSTAPRDVAAAFRDRLGNTSLYVADLDGIVHGRPDLGLLPKIVNDGFDVLADVGVRTVHDARAVADTGVAGVIVALETLDDPVLLESIIEQLGSRVVFSLDLKAGVPLRSDAWPPDPLEIVHQVVGIGARRLVVLDLAGVGMSAGVPTKELCRSIRTRFPDVRIVTGGGVRSAEDLAEVAGLGVEECLVASAVHKGALSLDEFR